MTRFCRHVIFLTLSRRPTQLCCWRVLWHSLEHVLRPGESESLPPFQAVQALNPELSPFPPPGAGCASSRWGCLSQRPRSNRCHREWPAARPTCAAESCPSWRWTRLSARSAPAGLHSLDALGEKAHAQMLVQICSNRSNANKPKATAEISKLS